MKNKMFTSENTDMQIYRSFIAFDVETTGLEPETDCIIELGATKFINGKAEETFNHFVDPGRPIPAVITQLTGITDADCAGKSSPEETALDFLSFAGNLPLVAHNADFDRKFVEHASGHIITNTIFDTLTMSRIHLPELKHHKLQTIATHFGYTGQFHRACDDALITGKIYLELLKKIQTCSNATITLIANLLKNSSNGLIQLYQPRTDPGSMLPDLTITDSASAALFLEAAEEQMDLALETRALNADKTADIFAQNGLLAQKLTNFEYRAAQEEMVKAVTRAFNDNEFALIEAGTGTGKSLAYLVPAIMWATQNSSRVVISTNTKNLQEQLFFKDIPFLKKNIGRDFTAALLKGRSNYLCLHKWDAALAESGTHFNRWQKMGILPLASWVEQTKTGDIAENAGFNLNYNRTLWGKLCAEIHHCRGPRCSHYNKCYLMRARAKAMRSHIVVINHSLLFADLITDASILGAYEYLVIDEAHNVEKTALTYFGTEFSIGQVRRLLNTLYDKNSTGLLSILNRHMNVGANPAGELKPIINQTDRVLADFKQFGKENDLFFKQFTLQAQTIAGKDKKFQYSAGDTFITQNKQLFADYSDRLRNLRYGVYQLSEQLLELAPGSFKKQEELSDQLQGRLRDLDDLNSLFTALIVPEQERTVFWVELPRKPKNNDTQLCSAPLDIAERLNRSLYSRMQSIIFTSATMAVTRSFKYIRERIGLNIEHTDRVQETLLESPFDFNTQSTTLIPTFLPIPKDQSFQDCQNDLLKKVLDEAERGTLILYTSYGALNKAGNLFKQAFLGTRRSILVQGQDSTRSTLMTQFQEEKTSVLLGTDSFWEGIDVPGDALEILVIARLPFAVPSEPIIKAQMDELEKAGKNPFMHFSVPEAVIKFRQGCGRLIRSRRDRGIILILDPRAQTTRYGKQFLQSIPGTSKVVTTENELLSLIRSW